MKVRAITVEGFRNVARSRFELGGIVGLVSPNNYGKSNVLDAVCLGVDFISASPRERRRLMSYDGGVPLSPSQQDAQYEFLIEFMDDSLGEYRFVRYGFSFIWAKEDGSGACVVAETLECKSELGGRWSSYLRRGEGYRARRKTRSYRKLWLDGDQLAIDVISAVEDTEIAPVVRRIKDIRFDMASAIDATSSFRSSMLEMKPEEGMSAFGSGDLARQLYRLREDCPSAYDTFEAGVYALFPEFEWFSLDVYGVNPDEREAYEQAISGMDAESLPFRVSDELYRITVKSRHLNQPLAMSRMSAGTQRVIWLLANTIIASSQLGDQILAVEEVETSIHPRMVHELLELLSENIGQASLLVTSHSPYLVQYLRPECLYVGVPNDEGIASFRRMRTSRTEAFASAAAARGMGHGEYLYSLMSGDADASTVLMSYLEA